MLQFVDEIGMHDPGGSNNVRASLAVLVVAAAALLCVDCGEQQPPAPDPASTTTEPPPTTTFPLASGPDPPEAGPFVPAGTVLTIVSGETDGAVGGASVRIGTELYTTNATGQLTLTVNARVGSSLDIVATGFLERQTVLRSPEENRFTLWPRSSPTGLDEHFTAEIIYTSGVSSGSGIALGSYPLTRVHEGRDVLLSLSDELLSDPEVVATHESSARLITSAAEGKVKYRLARCKQSTIGCFEVSVDPKISAPPHSLGGALVNHDLDRYIIGGKIFYYTVSNAKEPFTVLHEIGHTFGLNHCTARAVMRGPVGITGNKFADGTGLTDFTPAEKLAIKLMFQRLAGNQYRDYDVYLQREHQR